MNLNILVVKHLLVVPLNLAHEAVFGFENAYKARPASEGIMIDNVDMNEVRESFGLEKECNYWLKFVLL